MAGTSVTLATRSGPATQPVVPIAQLFVVGQLERGDTVNPITLNSMNDYTRLCGVRVAYGFVYDCLRSFFEEYGGVARVARVVGPAATKGTITLTDQAATPLSTLTLTAANEGAWSTGVSVNVATGSVPNTVTLTVSYQGSVVETFTNLASPAAIVAALLPSSVNVGSAFVRATDLVSATAAPANLPALGTFTLSAGTDDRTNVTTAIHTAALGRFSLGLGPGAVAIPGQVASAIASAVLAHCIANRRQGILALALGTTDAAATTAAAGLVQTNGRYLKLVHPWVQITDQGVSRLVPPEGITAACRARAIMGDGPWQAPAAGTVGRTVYPTGVEREIPRAVADQLYTSLVNPIRVVNGRPTLYGDASLDTDQVNYSLAKFQDTLNLIAYTLELVLEDLTFDTIDSEGRLAARAVARAAGALDPIRKAGGIFQTKDLAGLPIDNGYSVDAGPAVNPIGVINTNTLAISISVRLSPSAAFIPITLTKAALTAGV